ncbi:Uncharacterised protein [Mycobacteroides abscessus subsp. abscessus]|uniref:hypothetical protein n=1 Tax=Mycobacteroides abscessus TaxID=36809 RepID=UPI0009A72453|nr:hypothetical protein [Mycobacteroides abscessus]SLI00921.1 Uncharacterised protein [Mycobacteroides abscessus subsp. abscessus]
MTTTVLAVDVFKSDLWVGSAEIRLFMIAGFSAVGLLASVRTIQLWKRRKPSALAPLLIVAGLFGVVMPAVLALCVRPDREIVLPDAVGFVVVVLYIAALVTFAYALLSVVYRAVDEWWWKRQDRKHGDVWMIEELPDGSTRTHPSRVAVARELAANRVTSTRGDVAATYRAAGLDVPDTPTDPRHSRNEVTPIQLIYGDLAVFSDHYAVVIHRHVIFEGGEPVKFGGAEHLAANFLGFIRPPLDPAARATSAHSE